jgi:hypothetical protein
MVVRIRYVGSLDYSSDLSTIDCKNLFLGPEMNMAKQIDNVIFT